MQVQGFDPLELSQRLSLVKETVAANTQRLKESRDRLEGTRARWTSSRTLREASHDSAYMRLLARFESQPVIEQAKGILMAESHCTPDEAFDMLRRASQRQNIRVRDLAAQIVTRAATCANGRKAPSPTPPGSGRPGSGRPGPGSARP